MEINDIETIDNFIGSMKDKIILHHPMYGDSWKTCKISFLYDRLEAKMTEFRLTGNPDKLISIANLAMFLNIRKHEE